MYKQYKQFKLNKLYKQYKLFISFISFIAIWLGVLVPASAADSGYPWRYGNFYGGSAQVVCDQWVTGTYGTNYDAILSDPLTYQGEIYSYTCTARVKGGTWVPARVAINRETQKQCSGDTPSYNATTGQCEKAPGPDCSSKLPIVRKYIYANGVNAVKPDSYDGCKVNADEMLVCRKNAAGQSYCMWQVTRTGEPATGSPAEGNGASGSNEPDNPNDKATNSPPLPSDSKGNCPNGSVQAGVGSDGIPICMGTGTNPNPATKPSPTSNTTKSTDANGTTTEVTKTTSTNADGSTTTTTTTTTTAADGSKSVTGTTTTGTTANGSQGQKDGDPNGLCKENPNLTICRNSSVSGTCGNIACTGDAVQCATLRAAALMQCAQEKDEKTIGESGFKKLGDDILAGNDPKKGEIESLIKGKEIEVKANIDQNGFLGGGACIANKSFSVMGQSVTVEFDRICNDIQPIRAVIMLLAFVAAYTIVARTVLTM
jgi:hypothetical protein